MSDWKNKLAEARVKWFKIDTRGLVAKDEDAQTWICCGRYWINHIQPGQIRSTFGESWELVLDDPSTQGALEGLLYSGLKELFGEETSYSVSCRKGEFAFQFGNQEIKASSRGDLLAQALYVVMEAVQKKKEQILDDLAEQGVSIHNMNVAAKMVW